MKVKSKSKDLYVADISFEAEAEDLEKLFSICGSIRSIHMINDAKTGVFKGCAFVHMTTAEEAKDAINTLDGTRLIDRCISVTAALPRKTEAAAAKTSPEKLKRTRRAPKGLKKP